MTWPQLLKEEMSKDYMKTCQALVKRDINNGVRVYPETKDILNAFKYTPFDDVKVVMLGQNPYHGPNQAHGIAFSVQKGQTIPPSLVNMYKELKNDLGIEPAKHGDLTQWAKQGVLLLNSSLTVQQGIATSHMNYGWDKLTDKVISTISDHKEDVVFVLWGMFAGAKGRLIDKNKHHILSCAHPSPLSAHRGFFGCKHFSKTNEILENLKKEPINWQITNE